MENRGGILLPCAICEAEAGPRRTTRGISKRREHDGRCTPLGIVNEGSLFTGRMGLEFDPAKHKSVRK